MHSPRKLKPASFCASILMTFYRGCSGDSVFILYVNVASSREVDKKTLQRILESEDFGKIIGLSVSSVQHIFHRALNIYRHSSHPLHRLSQLLPSGKRYHSITCSTTRLHNSFLPKALRLLNQ